MTDRSKLKSNNVKNSSLKVKNKTDSLAEIISSFTGSNLSIVKGESSEVIEKLLQQELMNHIVRLHHVMKIERKRHRIPGSSKLKKALEKDGIYLHKIFLMCIAIHGRQQNLNLEIPYKSGFEWFQAINIELFKAAAQDILNPIPFPNHVKNDAKKRLMIRHFDKYVSEIKSLDDSRFSREDFSNPYVLMVVAGIQLSDEGGHFKDNYWLPFIQSMRDISSDIDSSSAWQRLIPVSNGIKRQGQGRAKTGF